MDPTTLTILAGLAAVFILPRLGIKLPSQPDPSNPTPVPPASWLQAIIEAILKNVLPNFLQANREVTKEVIRDELAKRDPVVPKDQPQLITNPDGTFTFIPVSARK